MISEKQINPQVLLSNFETKINFDEVTVDFTGSTEIGKMKAAFHQKIRNRQLDRIKAEKRKIHQINVAIESILQSDFPKESTHAKNWAEQLTNLYTQTGNYQTDPHKLREIFYLAQRFPSLGTLRLFYLAVLTSENKNIKTLADVDVWTFLHNILKEATVKTFDSIMSIERPQILPSLQVQKIDETTLQKVKLVIETFIVMFNKDITMRDYSIGVHNTYTGHLVHAYRIFKNSIRSELIEFLMSVFRLPPKEYKSDYLNVIRLAMGMINEYSIKIDECMKEKDWHLSEDTESLHDCISRIRNLFGVVSKAFQHATCKWLNEFLDKNNSTLFANHFDNTNKFLNFGLWVLAELISVKEENTEGFLKTFEVTVEMLHNLILFFMVMSEKSGEADQNEMMVSREILRKAMLILNFIKNCEENRVLSPAEKGLLQQIDKTKQICLFSLENCLHLEPNLYEKFIRKVIFYSDSEGNQFSLLELLAYFLRTSHNDMVMGDVLRVIFSLLSLEIPEPDWEGYSSLRVLLEQVMELMDNKVVTGSIKSFVVTFVKETFCRRVLKRSVGTYIGAEEILVRNINKFNEFMYSSTCIGEIFKDVEVILQFANQLQTNQQNF